MSKKITKIDEITTDDAEDLDLAIPMCNLIEYSTNYSETTGSLWFYSKDEVTIFNTDIVNDNNFKFFMYKAESLESTEADVVNGILEIATTAVPLKYLSNFWRSLEMPWIKCKVELKFKWTKHCVLCAAGNDNTIDNPNNTIFTIKDTNLYVPVVTLSARDNEKLSRLLSKGLEDQFIGVTIKPKTDNKNITNEYRYFFEPKFC